MLRYGKEKKMKTIDFRYSRKGNPVVRMIFIGCFWMLGFGWFLVLEKFGLQRGFQTVPMRELPLFWRDKPQLTLAVSIVPILLWMPFSTLLALRIRTWIMEERGRAEFRGEKVLLCFQGKELVVDKKTEILSCRGYGRYMKFRCYQITKEGNRYYINESPREVRELGRRRGREGAKTSLYKTMQEILPYTKESVFIGGIPLIFDFTRPTVFDDSAYYVDYDNIFLPEGIGIATCLVRERDNPSHVVGDLGFEDDVRHKTPPDEAVLRALPIIEAVELDEWIEV